MRERQAANYPNTNGELAAPSWFIYQGAPPEGVDPTTQGPGWWAAGNPQNGLVPVGASTLSEALSKAPPKLIVTDADSTLLTQEVIDELAFYAGVKDEVAAITATAMAGELGFTQSLHERVALLKGLPTSVFQEVSARLVVTPGTESLIGWAHEVGAKFGVVSGGFEEVLAPITDGLGVDFMVANRLEVEQGRLTGRVLGDVVDAAAKVDCARLWSGGDMAATVAVGDGANDIPMLRASGMGVAFCAKPTVREAATSFLDIPQLDAVIGLLGG